LQKFRLHKRKQLLDNSDRSTVALDDNPNGLLDWLAILRSIKDKDLKLICGTDVALFIVFQRLAAKFFAVVTIINFAVFIPIYLTGDPVHPYDV
jgi:hypothetical protein